MEATYQEAEEEHINRDYSRALHVCCFHSAESYGGVEETFLVTSRVEVYRTGHSY